MSLEYSDDNELIYQAKAVAKDIVNAKYEVTKKVGNFLFLAHSDEEFYQRATTVDEILESTSSRRLASVSDSKAKLVKALYQEWELKHASCDECKVASHGDENTPMGQCPGCGTKGPRSSVNGAYGMCSACDTGYNKPNPNFRGPKGEPNPGQFPYQVNLNDKKNYHSASSKGSSERNFKLPERVASPVLPEDKKSRKLWNKWSIIKPNKESGQLERISPFEGMDSEKAKGLKAGILDKAIGGSLGRLDDPEVYNQVTPGSSVWVDAHGLYGRDKKRKPNSLKDGRGEDPSKIIDGTKLVAMMGTVPGRSSLGHEGIFLTYHKCTGNTFRGSNTSDNSFPPCTHEHHEGDGCGLSSEVAAEGSTQPGCGNHHLIVKVQTPSFISQNGQVGAIPHMEDEQPKDISGLTPAERQQHINRLKTSEPTADDYTNPTEEQVGELPLHRLFLMHPEQSALIAKAKDEYHAKRGGEGRHPDNLDTFKIGDKTHSVGDIVSTSRSWGSSEPRTEDNLGVLVGVSSHQNGQHVRLGRSEGLAPNTEGESSMAASTPGEYSLMVHRLHDPTTGRAKHPPTAIDPGTGSIAPGNPNETTQYYPSSNVDTVEPFDAKKSGKGGLASKLYSRLKTVQSTFKANPETERTEKPKTVKPSKDSLDLSTLDLSDLFGNAGE